MSGWASLLFGLGLVGIVFGLLNLMLLLAGGLRDLAWIWANLGLGLLLLAVSLVGSLDTLRERLASGEARRVEKYGTSAILSTLLGIAILGGLGFLAERNPVRFDWSESGIHSLSDQTKKVLAGLERDVDVVAFYSAVAEAPVRELLERYRYESPRFKITFADPTARPELVQRYGIDPQNLGQGLVRIAIGDESVEITEVDESSLTNAIVKLTRTGQKKVYFLSGHGERAIDGEAGASKEGFSRAADALRNENYRYEELLLATRETVPDDADVVVIAGATRPLLPEEHRALAEYVKRGGSLLVLIDPRAKTDLYADLAGWGVDVGDDVIVDRMQGLFGRPASPFAEEYGSHPITAGMREPTLFHYARSVRPSKDAESRFTELVRTGSQSWAERNLDLFFSGGRAELDADDLRGPVPVAVAGLPASDGAQGDSGGAAAPRLVVYGDSDFASNQLLDAYRNRDLFVNSVNWLLGDVEAISIRPNLSRASRLQLSREQFESIRALSLFVLPETIAVLGVLAWWSRRRAPGR